MKLFLPELEVGDLDGFGDKDLFGRKEIADGLSHLLASISDPLVIALDAPWGAGKTVFLKQWAGELRNAGYPVVFFDAFRHDYTDDAFAALAGEIIAIVDAAEKATTTNGERFVASAAAAAKILARSGLRLGVKVATLNVLDGSELESAAKAIGDELSGLEDKYLGELLTRQRAHQATFDGFREALSRLPDLLGAGAGERRPLVLIIDELDRCRPVFALEMLERIKHFFSVPGVHFVLGANLPQLRNSVVAAYGAGIDAGTYLQKFIHFTVGLRETSPYRHETVTRRYIQHLARALEIGRPDQYFGLVEDYADQRGLSLRTLERISTLIARTIASMPERRFAPPPIVAGLCILSVVEPDIYERARRGALTWKEAATIFKFPLSVPEGGELPWDARWWAYVTGGPLGEEERGSFGRSLWNYNFSEETNLLAWVANNVVELLKPPG